MQRIVIGFFQKLSFGIYLILITFFFLVIHFAFCIHERTNKKLNLILK